jgi:hypothetical protein
LDEGGQAFFASGVADNIFKASNVIFLVSGLCYMVGSCLISKREVDQTQEDNPANQLAEESPPNGDADDNKVKSDERVSSDS